MDRDELVSHLDRLLRTGSIPDFGPQGLQVEGKREVRKVAVGVTASAELFRRAIDAGADLVLCHRHLGTAASVAVRSRRLSRCATTSRCFVTTCARCARRAR
jgi:putative NIF3 family GTP cyclohydrolase 1 type 2